MKDDPDDTHAPDLAELLGDSPAEQAEIEHLLRRLGSEHLAQDVPFLRLAFPETGIPAPAHSLPEGQAPEGESPVEHLRARAQAVLGALAAGRAKAKPLVAELLALAPAERWQRANEDPSLHELPAIHELLSRAERMGHLPAEEVESIALLVLQLVPRASTQNFPVRWLGDFLTQGWLLLAEVGLARRDLARASFATECAQAHLQTGSGDSSVVFEVSLQVAFLDWAAGRGLSAAAAFKISRKLAASLSDPAREGETYLWLALLFTQLGEERVALAARARALALLGPESLEQAFTNHLQTIDRLGLVLPRREPAPATPPVA